MEEEPGSSSAEQVDVTESAPADAPMDAAPAAADAAGDVPTYAAPVIPVPTTEDMALAEARKKVLRALDAKICEQDEPTALAAIETVLKLVGNIVDTPSEPKFRKFRSNNPAISKKLLRCRKRSRKVLSFVRPATK